MSPIIHQHTLPFGGDAFKIFCIFKDQPHAFFLDSSLRQSKGLFSYIGFDPFTTVSGRDLSAFKRVFDKYRLGTSQRLSFPAGAVGYLGYDGSLFFGFYDTIVSVDHQKHRLIISSFSKGRIKDVLKKLKSSGPDLGFPQRARSSCRTLAGARKSLRSLGMPLPRPPDDTHFKSNFSKADYMKAVRQALEHIRRGDIYQINLSHQIKMQVPLRPDNPEPAAIYENLRRFFPSEFGAYFDDGRQVILSASPERFLKLQNGIALLKPMKGTRPRGETRGQDRRLKEQLQKSPKEIAELLMVTDLERNDLGRVCDYSSVKVKVMRTIETYASVFQATSTVEGRLRRGCDPFDLLQALSKGGLCEVPTTDRQRITLEVIR